MSNLIAQCKDKDHLRSTICWGIQMCQLHALYCTLHQTFSSRTLRNHHHWNLSTATTLNTLFTTCPSQLPHHVIRLLSVLTGWAKLCTWNISLEHFFPSTILKCYSTNHCLYGWFHIISHCKTTWSYPPTTPHFIIIEHSMHTWEIIHHDLWALWVYCMSSVWFLKLVKFIPRVTVPNTVLPGHKMDS